MIDWVNQELDAWGRVMRGQAVQLGYTSETLEYRMMKYGPDSLIKDTKGVVASSVYISDSVARTEDILLAMGKYDRQLLIIAYTRMVSRDSQAKMFSLEIGYTVSRRQFMIDIYGAQKWYDCYCKMEEKFSNKINCEKVVDTCAQESV